MGVLLLKNRIDIARVTYTDAHNLWPDLKNVRVKCHACDFDTTHHGPFGWDFLHYCSKCHEPFCGQCLGIWNVRDAVCKRCAKQCSICKEWQYPEEVKPCAGCGTPICNNCNENAATDDELPFLCNDCAIDSVCEYCAKFAPDETAPCKCGDMVCHARRDDFGVCPMCQGRARKSEQMRANERLRVEVLPDVRGGCDGS